MSQTDSTPQQEQMQMHNPQESAGIPMDMAAEPAPVMMQFSHLVKPDGQPVVSSDMNQMQVHSEDTSLAINQPNLQRKAQRICPNCGAINTISRKKCKDCTFEFQNAPKANVSKGKNVRPYQKVRRLLVQRALQLQNEHGCHVAILITKPCRNHVRHGHFGTSGAGDQFVNDAAIRKTWGTAVQGEINRLGGAPQPLEAVAVGGIAELQAPMMNTFGQMQVVTQIPTAVSNVGPEHMQMPQPPMHMDPSHMPQMPITATAVPMSMTQSMAQNMQMQMPSQPHQPPMGPNL